jgi:hypothetical protein
MKITKPTERPYQLSLQVLANSTLSKRPEFRIYINNQVKSDSPVKAETVEPNQDLYTFQYLCDRVESVAVELLNKESNDTRVEDSRIIEDLHIVVKEIKIDNLQIGQDRFNRISTYQNDQGIGGTYGFMGFNGTMTFNIHKNILYTMFMTSVLE